VAGGRAEEALRLARAAAAYVEGAGRGGGLGAPGSAAELSGALRDLARARVCEGRALAALERHGPALQALRSALKTAPRDAAAARALLASAPHLPARWMAGYWAGLVEEGERPGGLTGRDGVLFKPALSEVRMAGGELAGCVLAGYVLGREAQSRRAICCAWIRGREPRRHEILAVRAHAYLAASESLEGGLRDRAVEQAGRDGAAAVAFAPRAGFARGHGALAAARAAALDWTGAVLSGAEAVRLARKGLAAPAHSPSPPPSTEPSSATVTAPGEEQPSKGAGSAPGAPEPPLGDARAEELAEYERALGTYVARLPDSRRGAFEAGGSEGLEEFLAEEREFVHLPEYKRQRPKYYYYYEWMTERIREGHPALEEPVMDKLLTMDAGELDLMLAFPEALAAQVGEYQRVLEQGGPELLETYQMERVSWDEIKALKGPATTGLGLADGAKDAGRLALERDTDHALVAGGGDGGLTAAEREGRAVVPQLPPDRQRDQFALEQGHLAERARLLAAKAESPAGNGGGDGGSGGGAAPGRRQAILEAAERAVLSSAAPVMLQGGDLDGVD